MPSDSSCALPGQALGALRVDAVQGADAQACRHRLSHALALANQRLDLPVTLQADIAQAHHRTDGRGLQGFPGPTVPLRRGPSQTCARWRPAGQQCAVRAAGGASRPHCRPQAADVQPAHRARLADALHARRRDQRLQESYELRARHL